MDAYKAMVEVSAELARKAYWRAGKYRALKRSLIVSGVIVLGGYAGYALYQSIMQTSLYVEPLILVWIWVALVMCVHLLFYYRLKSLNEGYRFEVQLDAYGVEIRGRKIPWHSYKYYREYDDYLEIHGPGDSISFLLKSDEFADILEFTRRHIPFKK